MTANRTSESYTPSEIHAGDYPIATKTGTAGAEVDQYDIVGRVTSGGKLVTSTKAAEDGSETPIGIAAVGAAADDDPIIIFTSGAFDIGLVGMGDRTAAECQVAFDRTPIQLVTTD